MACHLFSTKPLSEPILVSCLLDPWVQISVTFESEYNHFTAENQFENVVCKMATIVILTHLPLVPHICGSELGQLWFIYWLVAWSAPSHYLNQCWSYVNWGLRNNLQWHFNRYSYFFIQRNAFENVVSEMAAISFREWWDDMLIKATQTPRTESYSIHEYGVTENRVSVCWQHLASIAGTLTENSIHTTNTWILIWSVI